MNLFNPDKIVPEKVENLMLQRKDLTKVFQISKIKKNRTPKTIISKSKTTLIPNCNNIICHEINLSFKTIQRNTIFTSVNYNGAFKLRKRTCEKNSLNFSEKDEKLQKRKKFVNRSYKKERKIRKNNSLIKPVLVEDNFQSENKNKKKENTENSLKINIKKNYKFSSFFNNFFF